MIRAVLLDLDDTLVVEEAAAAASFAATAAIAAERHGADAAALAVAARARAREVWRAAPTFPYCERIGISSWEALWCRFEGDAGELPALRRWAPEYRHEAWRRALDALAGRYSLAVVTNGASCLQREKLAASGLADRFDAVVVGGDVGAAKPERVIFERALQAVGAPAREAVMVGNNLEKDVDGATAAGIHAIWVNRGSEPGPPDVPAVRDLGELPALLSR